MRTGEFTVMQTQAYRQLGETAKQKILTERGLNAKTVKGCSEKIKQKIDAAVSQKTAEYIRRFEDQLRTNLLAASDSSGSDKTK